MKKLLVAIAMLLAGPMPAAAASWTVDYAKSHLGFQVQWSGEAFTAAFKTWKADITFDPADLAHVHAVVTIDLASEASDAADNDEGLKGPEGFRVSKFPTAVFETSGFASKGGNAYVATGTLSLHGAKRPVSLPFTLTITGNQAHMTGKAAVLRTDFGLGTGDWAGETPIAHQVFITIDLTATKSG
jgi:polyisoprenoid-binding protein YceI